MLNLLTALLGPMFAKELLEVSRRGRYFANRLLYGAAMFITLLIIWEEWGGVTAWAAGREQINQLARVANAMFLGVGWIQLLAIYLFVPAFVCGLIAAEREAGTLDLLLTTQLHDREIVLGKLASRMLVMVAIVLSTLPILSLVMLFGGISPEGLWRMQAATLLSLVFAGSFAIYFSAITRSPLGAMVRTYFWLAVWLLLMPTLVIWLADELIGGRADDFAAAMMVLVNPGMTFVAATSQPLYDHARQTARVVLSIVGLPTSAANWFYPSLFVAPLAISAFMTRRAILRLRGAPLVTNRFFAAVLRARDTLLAIQKKFSERRRACADRAPLVGIIDNPLWLRSRRAPVYDREGHIGRAILGGWVIAAFCFLLVAAFEPRNLDDEEMSFTFVSLAWLGALLMTIVVSANSVVGDRRRGMLELLLVTPLSSRELVDGTLLAVWHHLRPIVWLPWLLTCVFMLTTATHPLGGLCSMITATLFCSVVLALGVLCSLVARHAAAALVPPFVFAVLMIVGTFFIIAVFDDGHGLTVWLATPVLLAVSHFWTGRSLNTASVACRFIAMHSLFCGLATGWTAASDQMEHPLCDMHPLYLTIVFLQNQFPLGTGGEPDVWTVCALPFYWVSLVANFVWARWWMIRHFDKLAGRSIVINRAHYGRAAPIIAVALANTNPQSESSPHGNQTAVSVKD